ncbi:MAG: hypothetical protein SFY92_11885 [Verrucomicrobiae bacterium]|nr:hypothetical protein [Verrucomicrobiae bacterium]
MKKNANTTVGLFFGSQLINPMLTSTAFYKMLLMNLQLIARANRWQSKTYAFDGDISQVLNEVEEDVHQGILNGVVMGTFLGFDLCELTARFKIPIVGFAQGGNGHHSILSIDMEYLINTGLDFLVKAGCSRLWVLGAPQQGNQQIVRDRAQYYGLDFCSERFIPYTIDFNDIYTYEKAGASAAGNLLELSEAITPRDGVLILDDVLASGFVKQMHEMGFQPGRHFQLASHCNRGAPTLFGYTDGMALLEIDSAEVAFKLLRRLDELMNSTVHGDLFSIRPKLIVPRSTGG